MSVREEDAIARTAELLRISLSAAVPMHVMELRRMPMRAVLDIARACGQVVAEKGDIIQFKSKKKGETAAAFNALARGLACASFCPGGVRFLGLHFEDVHPETLDANDIREIQLSLGRGTEAEDLAIEFEVDPHVIRLVGEPPL